MTTEKPPYVPTNAEVWRELEKLQNKVQKLEFDLEYVKTEQERLRREAWNRGR